MAGDINERIRSGGKKLGPICLVLLILPMVAIAGSGAGAEPIDPAPVEAIEDTACSRGLLALSACAGTSNADETTGELTLALSVVSPLSGHAPGGGSAVGFAGFRFHVATQEAGALTIRIAVHLDAAEAEHSGVVFGLRSSAMPAGWSYGFLFAEAIHVTCPVCKATAAVDLVRAEFAGIPDRRDSSDLEVALVVQNSSQMPVPDGMMRLTIGIFGDVALDGARAPDIGEAQLTLQATLTRVEISRTEALGETG